VDFIKNDCVYSNYVPGQVDAVSLAIDRSGRRMLYSLSPGADDLTMARRIVNETNMYRVTGDTWDRWADSIYSHFDSAQQMQPLIAAPNGRSVTRTPHQRGTHRWPGLRHSRAETDPQPCSSRARVMLCTDSGCGGDSYGLPSWPDLDMLPLGWLGVEGDNSPPRRLCNLTEDEQQTLMSLWTIFRSPLMYGGDLQHPDAFSLALLTNPEALAITDNSTNTDYVLSGPTLAIWRSDDAEWQQSGVSYFSVHNIGEQRVDGLSLSTQQLRGKQPGTACTLRDVWARQDIQHGAHISITLRAHQSGLYSLHSCDAEAHIPKRYTHSRPATA